jgi:hypothetical protein
MSSLVLSAQLIGKAKTPADGIYQITLKVGNDYLNILLPENQASYFPDLSNLVTTQGTARKPPTTLINYTTPPQYTITFNEIATEPITISADLGFDPAAA